MSVASIFQSALTAKPTPPRWISRLARPVGIPVIIISMISIYALSAGRIILNGSDSLAARGFYVVIWPKLLVRGAVIVTDPPSHLASRFEGMVFTKRLGGRSGDTVRHEGNAVCINDDCYPQTLKDGKPFGTLLEAGPIPSGYVALFGETPTSLDSRYAEVGLFPTTSIRGVGFAIPHFPDWTDIAIWVKS